MGLRNCLQRQLKKTLYELCTHCTIVISAIDQTFRASLLTLRWILIQLREASTASVNEGMDIAGIPVRECIEAIPIEGTGSSCAASIN
jgi:hypothetical protein